MYRSISNSFSSIGLVVSHTAPHLLTRLTGNLFITSKKRKHISMFSCIVIFALLFLQTQPATRQSTGVISAVPPPVAQQAPRQPANDLLGDLGGDPFAQPAGIINIVHYVLFITVDFTKHLPKCCLCCRVRFEVHKFNIEIHKPVCKQNLWLWFVQTSLWIQTLQRNELANFETKFGTFVQKLNEIDCKVVIFKMIWLLINR